MRVAVLIPAFNEARTIREIAGGARRHCEWVIVVDDGSTDGTAEALAGTDIQVVRHERNGSKGRRLAEGIDLAVAQGAGAVITLDADGQHDPDDIPKFLVAAGVSPGRMILGDRTADMERMPKGNRRANRVANFFVGWACAQEMPDTQCGFRLYPAEAWRAIRMPARERMHFIFETMVLLRAAEAGYGFARVPVAARYQGFVSRASHFRPVLDIARITVEVTRFIVSGGFRPRGLLIALGLLRLGQSTNRGERI